MREYLINIDLFCYRDPQIKKDYRLYVDDHLITERSYIWVNKGDNRPQGQFIRENVWVELMPGIHSVRIESVDLHFKGFNFINLLVDKNAPSEIKTINNVTKTFLIN